jgi:hypothetical protein
MELRLEVVIQRGRPEAYVGRDVGPLRVLVAAVAEALDRNGNDLAALAARTACRSPWGRPPGRRVPGLSLLATGPLSVELNATLTMPIAGAIRKPRNGAGDTPSACFRMGKKE